MSESPDERVLVAIRTDQAEFHVAGTRHGYRCSKCNCDLSVAPAGQRFLRENPHVPVLCVGCALASKPDKVEAAPGAIDELIADRVRRARKHQEN
jgi:hypothetical protein